jgi:hypothetical protein
MTTMLLWRNRDVLRGDSYRRRARARRYCNLKEAREASRFQPAMPVLIPTGVDSLQADPKRKGVPEASPRHSGSKGNDHVISADIPEGWIPLRSRHRPPSQEELGHLIEIKAEPTRPNDFSPEVLLPLSS